MIPLLVAFWLVFAGQPVLTWRRTARGLGEADQERRHQLKWIMAGSLAAIAAGAIDSIVSVLYNPAGPETAISSLLNDAGLAAFAARLQDAVDLDGVRDDPAAAVQQALEPAHVSVWVSHPDSS